MVELLNQGKKQDGNVLGESKNGFKGKTPLEADTSKNSTINLFDKRLEEVSKINDNYSLCEKAVDMAKAGLFDQAEQIANKIGFNSSFKFIAYSGIAFKLAKAGRFEEAFNLASNFEAKIIKERAEGKIVMRPADFSSFYCDIIKEMAKRKMFKEAFEFVKNKVTSENKSSAYIQIIKEMAKRKMFKESIKLTIEIVENDYKCSVLIFIGNKMKKLNVYDEETIELIFDVAKKYYISPEKRLLRAILKG